MYYYVLYNCVDKRWRNDARCDVVHIPCVYVCVCSSIIFILIFFTFDELLCVQVLFLFLVLFISIENHIKSVIIIGIKKYESNGGGYIYV